MYSGSHVDEGKQQVYDAARPASSPTAISRIMLDCIIRAAGGHSATAVDRLRPEVTRLFGTADAAEGVQSFVERRPARFRGY